jgi:hypothetical protein
MGPYIGLAYAPPGNKQAETSGLPSFASYMFFYDSLMGPEVLQQLSVIVLTTSFLHLVGTIIHTYILSR